MKEKKPMRTKELEWQRIGGTYLLYDKEENKNYTLQPIPFLVWIQCDGKTDVESIVDVFSVNGNRDIIKAAITGILDQLEKSGLIKWV